MALTTVAMKSAASLGSFERPGTCTPARSQGGREFGGRPRLAAGGGVIIRLYWVVLPAARSGDADSSARYRPLINHPWQTDFIVRDLVRLDKLAIITETSRDFRYSRGSFAADDVIRAALRIALSVYVSGVQINFLPSFVKLKIWL